jgi:hypothetical protein
VASQLKYVRWALIYTRDNAATPYTMSSDGMRGRFISSDGTIDITAVPLRPKGGRRVDFSMWTPMRTVADIIHCQLLMTTTPGMTAPGLRVDMPDEIKQYLL